MNGNLKATDRAAIVGVIDPDLNTAGALSTGWISMADWGCLMAIVMAGALGTSATLDAKIEQATDGSGTGVKDVSGLAITQLTDAGSDSDKQAVINVRQNDLDFNNNFTHVRLTMTVATASSDSSAVVLGFDPAQDSASANDLSSVDEIVG